MTTEDGSEDDGTMRDTTSGHHFVVVTFLTTPEEHTQAVREIGDYVEEFLSQQPGFIASRLLAATDGRSIVHQAEWTAESAFKAIAPAARKHPAFPKLMTYQPIGLGYQLVRSY
ncbi:MAG: antibiotic biosynthesis monooxygenase [Pseudomonadales bacterium]|nr:antibiotic biosynthesis monooxygenase [Pseudomonadales bacterium]